MNMKLNNKLLLGVLVGLGLVFFGTNYLKKNNSKTLLKTNMVVIDTAKVSKIHIKKSTGYTQEMIFSKKINNWEVSQETVSSKVKKTQIKTLLDALKQFKIERLVAKSNKKWETYRLTDSSATKVTIEENNGKKTIAYLGKVKHDPPKNQYNQYNRFGVSGETYVRFNNDPNVYAVKGMLTSTFNRNFNSWRNSDFLKVDNKDVTKIQFDYPKDEGFSLIKKETGWTVNERNADSTKVAQYLNTLSFKSNSKFADAFAPSSQADYKLKIEGNNMNAIIIEAYKGTTDEKIYLKSALNPDVFFESDSTGVFKELFVSKTSFIN